jgi:hypothetical protein
MFLKRGNKILAVRSISTFSISAQVLSFPGACSNQVVNTDASFLHHNENLMQLEAKSGKWVFVPHCIGKETVSGNYITLIQYLSVLTATRY